MSTVKNFGTAKTRRISVINIKPKCNIDLYEKQSNCEKGKLFVFIAALRYLLLGLSINAENML